MMLIEYLKGPMVGQTEFIMDEMEERGIPVYITESGKHLSNSDLNKLFRIKSDPGIDTVNLAELGDPSLIELEADYNMKPKMVAEQRLPSINKKEKESKPQVDDYFTMIFKNAKTTKQKINVNMELDLPTKDFYNLINNSLNITDEEFFSRIYQNLDSALIREVLFDAIGTYYNKTKKAKNTPNEE